MAYKDTMQALRAAWNLHLSYMQPIHKQAGLMEYANVTVLQIEW